MVGWMIYYRDGAVVNQGYIDFHIEEAQRLGIEIQVQLIEEMEFGVVNGEHVIMFNGVIQEKPDFAMVRAIYPMLNEQLEMMGIPTFNSSKVSYLCNDKAKTYQFMARAKIPMIDTVFCKNNLVINRLEKVENLTVVKAVDGHGGTQVFLYDPMNPNTTMEEIHQGLRGSDAVIQPLVGSKGQDLRVYVLGNEIVAAVLRTAKEGFKSNFSLGGEVSLYQLSAMERKTVERLLETMYFDYVGIDFIVADHGELIFNEIEDVVGSRMLYQSSDINIVRMYLEYIVKQLHVR